MRIGFGYDVHRLVAGRRLILGGVEIEYMYGLLGHSDADVLIHAIADAMLGALSLGDIGMHFPDTDSKYKDMSGAELLGHVYAIIGEKGYRVGNIDATIAAERPKLRPYIDMMRENIAKVINIDIGEVSIKATTEEGLGFSGRLEGIKAYAVCLLEKI